MTAVKIRPWTAADLDDLVRFADNPNVARRLTDAFPNPYTVEDGKAFLAAIAVDNPVRVFAIEVDGRAVGSIGVFPQSDVHRRNAEMGYWLAEEYWGLGIVAQAIGQIVEYGFRTFDIDRIFARPFGSNLRSQRGLEKAGFTLEARFSGTVIKDGKHEDEIYFAIRK